MPAVERENDQSDALLAAVCAKVAAMQPLTQSVPVVVFVVDTGGIFRACVGRPLRHFTQHPAALIGQTVADLTSNPAILGNVARAMQDEAFDDIVEARGQTFETRYEPIRDAHGVVHGTLGMAVNITRHIQAEAALDQLRAQVAAQATGLLDVVQPPASVPAAAVAAPPDDVAARSDLVATLTERQHGMLHGVGLGKTNKAIARELHISPKTIAKHLTEVYRKLGVGPRTEAAAWAVRAGLVE